MRQTAYENMFKNGNIEPLKPHDTGGNNAVLTSPVMHTPGFFWNPALTNRLRVLLHTFPLQELRYGDSLVNQELRHYDSLVLAMKVLDLIIDGTGLEQETGRKQVERALAPLLTAMDAKEKIAPDSRRHGLVIDRVLGGLRNDSERRRPFSKTYTDFTETGEVVHRKLEFRLVVDHFHPDGGTVLRLSNEAINLFLNAFELDIEDAQTAAEAVLQSQLERGRFDEAVQSARNARLQSLRFAEKLTRIMHNTRRDLASVDWQEQVPQLLSEALHHIESRLISEANILGTTEERLTEIPDDEQQARVLIEVRDLVHDCRLRHTELHPQLMKARNTFLDEQARQSFILDSVLPMPHMLSDVLQPLLTFSRKDSLPIVESALPCFFGAAVPPVLSLAEITGWLLRPRREQLTLQLPVIQPDLSSSGADFTRFPAEINRQVDDILGNLPDRTVLSDLLEELYEKELAREVSPEVYHLLVLRFLHAYAPDRFDQLPFRVEKVPGSSLRTPLFFGDDMIFIRN